MRPANTIFMQRTVCVLAVESFHQFIVLALSAVLGKDNARLCIINTGLTPSSGANCQVPRGMILTAEALVCGCRSEVARNHEVRHGSIQEGGAKSPVMPPFPLQNPLAENTYSVGHFKIRCYIPWVPVSEAADATLVWLCLLRFKHGMCPHEKACCLFMLVSAGTSRPLHW